MEGFVTAYAMLTIGVGSIDIGYLVRGREVRLPAGVAHYLEHKMFDCPDGDAMQRFDALGASANAFTSFDKTAYYFSCTENFSEALEVLLDFVTTPYFIGSSVRRERGIIAEELRMYRDSPEWIVTANLLQAMYHVHPVRVDIAGTEESIAEIDAALLRRCYDFKADEALLASGGVVLKYNASQKYTTNAVSGAIFRAICRKADVPVQAFTNRADAAGGLGRLRAGRG